SRLERSQPWRGAEGLAVELLVDVHDVAAELGVDRVAAAAEIDEVQQREVLLELVLRDVEAVDELSRVDLGLAPFATGRQQIGEERLQHGEPLGRNWPGGPRRHPFHSSAPP